MSDDSTTPATRGLPAGWCWAKLEQVFSSITDGDHSAPPQVEEGVPFLVIGNVRKGTVDFTDVRFVPHEYYESIGEPRTPRRGDVLYTVTGSFGIPVLVDSDQEFCVQRHIAILKPSAFVSARYLSLGLATTDAYHQAAAAATGTAQKTLGLKLLRQFRVPFAPRPEQQRIVSALESYFTRLDDAVTTLERVERNLKRYRASVLKAAVEGRLVPTEAALARQEGRDYEPASVLLERILTARRRRWAKSGAKGQYQEPMLPDNINLPELPEGWCWASIDQIGDVSGGVTKNAKRDKLSRTLPYLRVANVYANELRLDEIKDIGLAEPVIERVLLKKNDLLVVEGNGSLDQIGRVALWNASIEPCVHQNHLIKIRFEDATLPEWALTWLLSPGGRLAIQHAASSTSGLHTLSISKIARLPIPLCPQPERARISSEIARAASLLAAAEKSTEANRRRCTRLRQSILKWAFEGKLADQDPNDEPASVLLDRIKAERDTPKPAKKKTRP